MVEIVYGDTEIVLNIWDVVGLLLVYWFLGFGEREIVGLEGDGGFGEGSEYVNFGLEGL